mmetsp:Transcript_16449/g.51039  ORF Transcript_16449/g.51039 Transcript_16449/m.51039 type:complete len:202 (+) Transcript_16449:925-1530(+)
MAAPGPDVFSSSTKRGCRKTPSTSSARSTDDSCRTPGASSISGACIARSFTSGGCSGLSGSTGTTSNASAPPHASRKRAVHAVSPDAAASTAKRMSLHACPPTKGKACCMFCTAGSCSTSTVTGPKESPMCTRSVSIVDDPGASGTSCVPQRRWISSAHRAARRAEARGLSSTHHTATMASPAKVTTSPPWSCVTSMMRSK